MHEIITVILAISLIVAVPAAMDLTEKDLNSNNNQEIIEDVRKSSAKIIISEENITTATQLLASLPETDNKIRLAVYSILDKTGAYDEKGSPIVTQGATEMLVTALGRSRQYKILDRINFSDFMNEQNLVSNNRIKNNNGPQLGGMTGADYLIGGAVTEYQIDKRTGGLGLKIAGKGGSKEYAVASCAIDLRVTDTTTGEVVWAKSLKGKIEGAKVGLQLFSFMGENIVEFETGKGKQEVINLVVRTLLEEAIYKLSISGNLKSN